MDLPLDRRSGPVVEQVTDAQLVVDRRVQGDRRAVLANEDRLRYAVHGTASSLIADAGLPQGLDETLRRAIEAGRFRGVQLHQAVVDTQARQGREDVFDQADLPGTMSQRGPAACAGYLLDLGGDKAAVRRSVRTKTTPLDGGAGKKRRWTEAPVRKPTPRTSAGRTKVR